MSALPTEVVPLLDVHQLLMLFDGNVDVFGNKTVSLFHIL
jgi:hypothetical protein